MTLTTQLDPKAIALRVATFELIHSIQSEGVGSHPLCSLVDDVLKNTQAFEPEELKKRIVTHLNGFVGQYKYFKEMKVFIRTLTEFLGPGFTIPVDGCLLSKLGDLSERARGEILSFHEARENETGETIFSHDTLLEIRQYALLRHCHALERATLHQIEKLLNDAENDPELLSTLWVFADENDDGKLKAILFPRRSKDAERKTETREEINAFETVFVTGTLPSLDLRGLMLFNASDSLFLLEWAFLERCEFSLLSFECNDPVIALGLSQILSKYVNNSSVRRISITTKKKDVLAILIPSILRTGINDLTIQADEGFETLGNLIEKASLNRLIIKSGRPLTAQEIQGLAAFIKKFQVLKKFHIISPSTDPAATLPLIESLRCRTKLEAYLEINIGREGIDPLSEMIELNPRQPYLQIHLDPSALQNGEARRLARALKQSNPAYLHLELDRYSPGLDTLLSESPPTLKIRIKEISSTFLTRGIAQMLRTSKVIEALFLTHTHIGDEEGEILMSGLEQNTTLKNLDLSDTGIGIKTLQKLAQILRTKHPLRLLSLDRNKFSDDHLAILAEGLAHNTSVYDLDLSWTEFSFSALANFAEQLKSNHSLIGTMLTGKLSDEEKEKLSDIFKKAGFSFSTKYRIQITRGIKK